MGDMRLRSTRKNAASPPTPSPRPRRDGPPAVHARGQRRPPAASHAPQDASERKMDGGPQDRALYGCHCGSTFRAPVIASVACPHCGATQAW
jgi:hypothetical protein